jgi:NADH-quinone oxidoreductase subunit N
MSNVSIIITILIFLNSQSFDKNYAWNEFYTLALFSLCGAHILFGFTHLLTMFLGVEILSIPLYVLAASNKENKFSLEAGLKYFILGSFSSAIMLFALALIYGAIGSLSVYDIVQNQLMFQTQTQPFFLIGVTLIVIAVLFKFAVVPFHFWTPDVYTGSPTIVTSFMATVVKIAIANVLIFLFIGYFAIQNALWIKLFTVAIILSLVISNVIALYQKNIKRLMAYSSISHSAFLLMALIVSYYAQNQLVVLYYLVSYVLVSVLIFMIISQFSADTNKSSLVIFDGMYKKSPFFYFRILPFYLY